MTVKTRRQPGILLALFFSASLVFFFPGMPAAQNQPRAELDAADAAGARAQQAGDYAAMAEACRNSARICEQIYGREHEETASRYNLVGLALSGMNRPDEAIAWFEKALASGRTAFGENHAKIAVYCNNIGLEYDRKGDYGRAAEFYGKALAVRLKISGEDHADTAMCRYNLGQAQARRGDYDSAVKNFRKALPVFLKSDSLDFRKKVRLCFFTGQAYSRGGDSDKAIEYLLKAGELQRAGDPGDAETLSVIYADTGTAYWVRGDVDRAVEYTRRARDLLSASKKADDHLLGVSCMNLGFYLVFKKDYDGAIENTLMALDLFRKKYGARHWTSYRGCVNLCNAYQKKGDYRRAIRYGEEALALEKELRLQDEKSLLYILIAFSHSGLGEHDRAMAYCEQAFASSGGSKWLQHRITVAKECGYIALEAGAHDRALRYFRRSAELLDGYRQGYGSFDTRMFADNIVSFYYLFKISALLRDTASAFDTAERMRSRGFLDRLSLDAALKCPGISARDRSAMLSLNDAIRDIGQRMSSEQGGISGRPEGTGPADLSREKERLEAEFDALDERLLNNERYRALRKPRFASLDEAKGLCGEKGAILEYVIWEKKASREKECRYSECWCLVITRGRAVIVPLDRDFDYSGAVREYRETLVRGPAKTKSAKVKRARLSALLYGKLLAPLEKELEGITGLTVAPDGPLAFLPFDSLHDGKKYLCERFSIAMIPSVSVLLMNKARELPSRSGEFLAFGGGVYSSAGESARRGRRASVREKDLTEASRAGLAKQASSGKRSAYYSGLGLEWSNLSGTAEEVEAIRSGVFRGRAARVLCGKDVSEKNIKMLSEKGVLAGYRTLHLACHGYYDREYPSFSAVVFSEVSGALKDESAEDGYLTVEEAALLDLQADIVNLSACETGLGKNVSGDGIVGLARAFNVAGAKRVGVTLWQVHDEATRDFMIRVYTGAVKEKKGYREAYAGTKRDFLRSKRYSDPYYWSPFVLYGE